MLTILRCSRSLPDEANELHHCLFYFLLRRDVILHPYLLTTPMPIEPTGFSVDELAEENWRKRKRKAGTHDAFSWLVTDGRR